LKGRRRRWRRLRGKYSARWRLRSEMAEGNGGRNRWPAPGSGGGNRRIALSTHWPRVTSSLRRGRKFPLRNFSHPEHPRPLALQRHLRDVTHCDVIPLRLMTSLLLFPRTFTAAGTPLPLTPPSHGAFELKFPLFPTRFTYFFKTFVTIVLYFER